MYVTHVNGKPYKLVTIKVGHLDIPQTRCKSCAFNHDEDACVAAGSGCTYDKVEEGMAGYFVPAPGPDLDEQCGVGNG